MQRLHVIKIALADLCSLARGNENASAPGLTRGTWKAPVNERLIVTCQSNLTDGVMVMFGYVKIASSWSFYGSSASVKPALNQVNANLMYIICVFYEKEIFEVFSVVDLFQGWRESLQ